MSDTQTSDRLKLEEVAEALDYLASRHAGGSKYFPALLQAMAKDVRAARRIVDLLSPSQVDALEYWRGFETRDGDKDLELLEALE